MAKRIAVQRLEEEIEMGNIVLYPGYAEPGYDDKKHGVAMADWNVYADKAHRFELSKADGGHGDYGHQFRDELEAAGYGVEWHDEWTSCGECGKLFRAEPDSYGWMKYGFEMDGEEICGNCIKANPTDYLEWMENKPDHAVTIPVDPVDYGYIKVPQDFENGFYGGQDDDPNVIAANLRGRDITRFLFLVDSVGQFDMHFSLYVHIDQADKLRGTIESRGTDPAKMLDKAFKAMDSIPAPVAPKGGVVVNEIKRDGSVETHIITSEQFIRGDWKE